MRRIFLGCITTLFSLLLSTSFVCAQYTQTTVLAVRVGLNPTSNNTGGANVVTGINVVPFQLTGSTWNAGSAFTASPTGRYIRSDNQQHRNIRRLFDDQWQLHRLGRLPHGN
jgi:hypothetical protein